MACRLKDDTIMSRNEDVEDLLVFGYSCKLFRDDEKALYIDQGKHLIPWMGDESLKIDRYDARGTLYDLKHAEAPSGGFDRFLGLTDIERQVETMCDEERYRALTTNEEEESMYQEEELKRFHFAIGEKGKEYGQVEYKYDGNSNNVENIAEKTIEKNDDCGDDEPFVPSPQLDVPVNMVLPESTKHNAIIEKTALFINGQGPQMEILLKMKQAGNPLFNFLAFDNPLHSYYRHLLMAIKGGRYKPSIDKSEEKKDAENEEDDYYLHPSLASSVSKVELAPSIPSINYKPSAHCAYSMLVNKIKDKKAKSTENAMPNHLSKLKFALERYKSEKKEEEYNSANDSDSNCSTESRSSIKTKAPSRSNISTNSFINNKNIKNQPFEIPPNDIQIIIDKMASYVAKNGRDFEIVVQMKKDPRFDFLNSNHVFNVYYQYKVRQYENLDKPKKPEDKIKSNDINCKGKDEPTKTKLTPVSFSIKKPKESETVIEKSALPLEESSDEEEKNDGKKENSMIEEKEGKEDIITVDLAAMEDKEEKHKKILATERIKDKLTAAMREKVALASKEKQLQLERKRRAAAFLRNLQTESGNVKIPTPYGPQLPGGEALARIMDEDSDITSLPDETDGDIDEKKRLTKMDKHVKSHDGKLEKRRKILKVAAVHKHKEKLSDKSGKKDKVNVNGSKSKEGHDRITDSSLSSDENEKRKISLVDDYRKIGKNKIGDSYYSKNKFSKVRSSRSDDRRHKRKKSRKDDGRDKNTRKHLKSKKQKRNRGSDDERNSRSKRCKRDSDSSSDEHNS